MSTLSRKLSNIFSIKKGFFYILSLKYNQEDDIDR